MPLRGKPRIPRRWAAAALIVGLAAISLGAHHPEQIRAGDPERANVIVVMTDDQGLRSMEVMRAVRRKLAARGVAFDNFFTSYPRCCPSRATYLTGQYAHNHKVMSSTPPGGFAGFDGSTTIAVALQRAGYRTGWIGKYLNGYPRYAAAHPRDIPPGFSDWFVGLGRVLYDWSVNDQGRIRELSGRRNYQTEVYAREAARFVRRGFADDRPFFLTVAPFSPHGEPKRRGSSPNPRAAPGDEGAYRDAPFPGGPAFNEGDVSDKPRAVRLPPLSPSTRAELRDRHRSRLASLRAVDRLVARLVSEVRRAGEGEKTYFFFTSDNGYMLGEHRIQGKVVLYEESIRVPLVIRAFNGSLPEGVRRDQLTANIDLAPTVLDLTRVAPLEPVDGISLLPLARDPKVGRGRDILLENDTTAAVRRDRFMYAEHDIDGPGRREFELYDLEWDPYQLESRHDDPRYAPIRGELAQRLAKLRSCSGFSCR